MLKAVASRFAKAQGALAKAAITYPGWRSRLKVAGCLAWVTVVSFVYFAGLIDLKSVQGSDCPTRKSITGASTKLGRDTRASAAS